MEKAKRAIAFIIFSLIFIFFLFDFVRVCQGLSSISEMPGIDYQDISWKYKFALVFNLLIDIASMALVIVAVILIHKLIIVDEANFIIIPIMLYSLNLAVAGLLGNSILKDSFRGYQIPAELVAFIVFAFLSTIAYAISLFFNNYYQTSIKKYLIIGSSILFAVTFIPMQFIQGSFGQLETIYKVSIIVNLGDFISLELLPVLFVILAGVLGYALCSDDY